MARHLTNFERAAEEQSGLFTMAAKCVMLLCVPGSRGAAKLVNEELLSHSKATTVLLVEGAPV